MNFTKSIPQPFEVRSLVESSTFPLVLNDISDVWKLLNIDEWKRAFQDMKIPFRRGYRFKCKCNKSHPQWERHTEEVKLTFDDFLRLAHTKDHFYWYYFDYKRIEEWLPSTSNIVKELKWTDFGFIDTSTLQTTIWIGSQGAHTPCHQDTYDNNLVMQIHGEKKWILFPPKMDLEQTRLPYEESSVYSNLDFYNPDFSKWTNISDFNESLKVILKPGQCLVVPQGWWHYVENVTEVAINANIWIPSKKLVIKQVHESIVQLFVGLLTKNLSQYQKEVLLNPNSANIPSLPFSELLEQIKYCTKKLKQLEIQTPPAKKGRSDSVTGGTSSTMNIHELLKKYSHSIMQLKSLTVEQLKQSLQKKLPHENDINIKTICHEDKIANDFDLFIDKFLNAVCHIDVLELITKKLQN